MIPDLIPIKGSPWPVLPPGQHPANLDEIKARYATNRRRRELYEGLVIGALQLRAAGCPTIYLDGSFVTGKPKPGDFDACWEPNGINPTKLDLVFGDFTNGRKAQKTAFMGEFFPASVTETASGLAFVDFFQVDRFSGEAKGILMIELTNDPVLIRRSK